MTEHFVKRVRTYSHICIVLTFTVIFMIAAQQILVPLAFSALFAIVLNPYQNWLGRRGMGRILSILLVMFTSLLVLSAIIFFSAMQLNMLLNDLPSIQNRIIELFNSSIQDIEGLLGRSLMGEGGLLEEAFSNAAPFFTNVFQTTSSLATVLVQMPIYTFLIMLYRDKFMNFFEEVWTNKNEARDRVDEIKNVIQSYVNGLLLVIAIMAVLNTAGLLLLGIRYAVFFGIFSAILTVIPYLGNFIGGLFPFLVALVTKDSAWYAVGVIAVYAFVQFLEGNFITPKIMGSQVSINPLAALVALIVGGLLLGIGGMILAIPAVGIVKTILSHSKTLRPLVLLIEDKPKSIP